jgi:hypothetical protein
LSRITKGTGIGRTGVSAFFRDRLHEGLYCGRKGKRYAMEVVTTAEKLSLDDLEDIKDNLGEA